MNTMEKINDIKEKRSDYKLYEIAYRYWQNMHGRVTNNHNYKNVTICRAWYKFSNYYKWFEMNYVDGWEVDKDILSGGLPVYCSKKCMFVPHEVNQLFRNGKKSLRGVVANGNGYQAQITIDGEHIKLGTFSTKERANEEYITARKKRCLVLSKQYCQYRKLSSVLKKLSK